MIIPRSWWRHPIETFSAMHRSPMDFPHKGQWRGTLISMICAWTNGWANNQDTNLIHHRPQYDVSVMYITFSGRFCEEVYAKCSGACCPDDVTTWKPIPHNWFFVRRIRRYHDDVIEWKHFPRYWPFCGGNSPVAGEFPAQRPVTRSFDVFFDLCLNKRLNKQSGGWWFETPSLPLWRHCNDCVGVFYRLPEQRFKKLSTGAWH